MKRALSTFVLVLVLAALYGWWAPGTALRPGRLLAAHDSLDHHCLACHTPGGGAPAGKCITCHDPGSIGLVTVAGLKVEPGRTSIQGLHQRFAEESCGGCHREHSGRLEPRAAAGFTHDRMPAALAEDCAACHKQDAPPDKVHSTTGTACGACHGVDRWLPATFDHDQLAASGRTCLTCHSGDRPTDTLHGDPGIPADCAACHRTRAWSPATFEHEPYFRFDSHHPARCVDCHKPGREYGDYDCMGCHAHRRASIEAEHREEGIRDIRDCVECHRSGNEHEILGRGRSTGGGERGEHGDEGDDD